MRPPGPVPERPERSIPFASAIFRARGEALMRSDSAGAAGTVSAGGTTSGPGADTGAGATAGTGSVGSGSGRRASIATGRNPPRGSGFGSSAAGSTGAACSPSSSRTARVAPISALPPSSIKISERIPSSKASIAMVALSVSISAISSPISTWSPTFLSQRTTVPSVMVSESLGISMCVAIGRRVRLDLW